MLTEVVSFCLLYCWPRGEFYENRMEKSAKEIYGTKLKAKIINLLKQKYLMIKGKGNPNESDFSNRVAVLFSL